MRLRALVVRAGRRPFPTRLAPDLEIVDRATHRVEDLSADAALLAGRWDRVIFTSGIAVASFFGRLELAARLRQATAEGCRLVAVGPATALRLGAFLPGRIEEGGGSARRLLERLPRRLTGLSILLPRGEDASGELPEELSARGAHVVPLTLYRKVALPFDPALDGEILAGRFAVFCATSPSAAYWLFRGASAPAGDRLRQTTAVALGEATRGALDGFGVRRVEVAAPATFGAAARLLGRLARPGSEE